MNNKIRVKTNLFFGILAIIIGLIIIILIPNQIGQSTVTKEYIDGRFIPYTMAGLIILCGIGSILKSVLLKSEDIKEIEIHIESKIIVFIGFVILYAVSARYISFMLSSIVFSVLILLYLKCKDLRKYIVVLTIVIIVCLLFKYGLKVNFGGLIGV